MMQFQMYLTDLTKRSCPSQQSCRNFQIFECMLESG
ncbi:hypothetical protein Gotri_027877 [Gossypium trilobum]|uniref:Uncharacterized protein n=1 Tax=Gossypium trilobum TaxID=34281 RepID=A0A7J9FP75_9ROSI|nr:hypothetical protein [Gossypium trilobum]